MRCFHISASFLAKTLPFICGLSFATSVQAVEVTVENLQLDNPQWSLTQKKGPVAQLKNGSGGMVLITPYFSSGGDKETTFQNFLTTIDPQGQEDWDIKQGITSRGYNVLYTSGFLDIQGVRMYVVPVAFFSNGEIVTATLFDPGYQGKADLQESFGNLLSSARFINNPTPQNNAHSGEQYPAVKRQGLRSLRQSLDGFYVGIGAKAGVSLLAQVTVEVGAKGLWMQPDGRYALTETGISEDFEAYCGQYPNKCGRYQITNGQYTTWRAASTQDSRLQLLKVDTKPLTQSGNDLILGKTRYRYVAPAANLKLNGDYRLIRADSATAVGGETNSGYAETTYGFSPDGRFVKGGSVSMFSDFGGSSVLTNGDRKARIGSYQVNDYTLTLTFDDGEIQQKAFFMMDGVPVIEGDLYEKLNQK
ncbi:MAG: hypothetical protein AAGE84_08830 [Cyanobacteria bacterium P01_G01_bin.39]